MFLRGRFYAHHKIIIVHSFILRLEDIACICQASFYSSNARNIRHQCLASLLLLHRLVVLWLFQGQAARQAVKPKPLSLRNDLLSSSELTHKGAN